MIKNKENEYTHSVAHLVYKRSLKIFFRPEKVDLRGNIEIHPVCGNVVTWSQETRLNPCRLLYPH